MPNLHRSSAVCLCLLALGAAGGLPPARALDRETVLRETMQPYRGPVEKGVDRGTLDRKVLCGYQGWFNAEGDGAGRGWVHWTKGKSPPRPDTLKVDLWPDMTEYGPDERFPTEVKHADGHTAELFSSFKKATVLRHFRWMRDYGIDGALVQRFVRGLRDPLVLRHNNVVLAHCREGANSNGRTYAVEYDLSGSSAGRVKDVLEDWRQLRRRMRITEDAAYLHHGGRPVVGVWGIGFNDGRNYTLAECRELIAGLRSDGCCVVCGVPTGWRKLHRDAVADPALHEILRLGHFIRPWTVGRYRTLAEVTSHAEQCWKPDLAWCRENGLGYLSVVFPGFSWHNMHSGPLDQIPRQKGQFLWRQFRELKRVGGTTVSVAMFDEVDEGTAIFKCMNDAPTGNGAKLVTFEGLPSDFYLKLVGRGGRLIRGEIEEKDGIPGVDDKHAPAR